MPQFLELIPARDAIKIFLGNLPQSEPDVELVDTENSLDRVLVSPVYSPEALPAFPRSTVDGYAVIAADSYGASDTLPTYLEVIGEVPMGGSPDFTISTGKTAVIHTGGMLPDGADAIVMIEHTQTSRLGEVEIHKAVAIGENTIEIGEDVGIGDEVLQAGIKLRPAEIGGLLALGFMKIEVARRPRVGIISSGDEVISPAEKPQPGQVRDINSHSLSALVQKYGGVPVKYGIITDQVEALYEILKKAYDECDLVVVTAGSSASERDLTSKVIMRLGSPGVLVHGVNVRPGKPTILAVCNGKPVIGLPGNPVSALVISSLFIAPVIDHLLGHSRKRPQAFVRAELSVNVSSVSGREDYIPVRLRRSETGFLADPIFFKSNLIFTLVQSDGLMYIPADAVGLSAGENLDIILI
ncbi:MAG: molybdopterin-binding protein [Anaerolineaceae bacterium]|nr:molybdopterin-binding protein [Anaerolineaceae bacterium]